MPPSQPKLRAHVVVAVLFASTAACLPHLTPARPASTPATHGEFSATGYGIVPTRLNQPVRPGVAVEGVLPPPGQTIPEARTLWVVRGAFASSPFFDGRAAIPTIDPRLGVRRLLVSGERLTIAGEVGGMATFFPLFAFTVGADAYAALHASLVFGAWELFVSGDAAAGVLYVVGTSYRVLTSVAQLGGGLAWRGEDVRLALVGGVSRQWLDDPSLIPSASDILAPYAGLQLSFDLPARK